ncbi:condensation domain-containing protein [Kitasatospora acidiphila]|uniref:hypothetical protein n=1 Tax=Kitasatospora acidiphila TaxID=2567942 RepID=UPI0015EFEDE5|nr:hypothetical protein [Kitasatospora acidiphila]
MVQDHTTMEVLLDELAAFMTGRADRLPQALPFRNFVAQARLGVSREEHQRFFAGLLGDVTQTTAPFGLLDVHGDGSGVDLARLAVDQRLADQVRALARRLGMSAAPSSTSPGRGCWRRCRATTTWSSVRCCSAG